MLSNPMSLCRVIINEWIHIVHIYVRHTGLKLHLPMFLNFFPSEKQISVWYIEITWNWQTVVQDLILLFTGDSNTQERNWSLWSESDGIETCLFAKLHPEGTNPVQQLWIWPRVKHTLHIIKKKHKALFFAHYAVRFNVCLIFFCIPRSSVTDACCRFLNIRESDFTIWWSYLIKVWKADTCWRTKLVY